MHLIAREDAKPGVGLTGAPAQARGKSRHEDCLQVPDDGYERESGEHERPQGYEHGRPAGRSSPPESSAHEGRRPAGSQQAADTGADRLGPVGEEECGPDGHGRREHHSGGERCPSRAQHARGKHAYGDSNADEEADRVPDAHSRSVDGRPPAKTEGWGSTYCPKR